MNGYIVVRRTKGGRWVWRFDVVTLGEQTTFRRGTAATEADARRDAEAVAFEWECGRMNAEEYAETGRTVAAQAAFDAAVKASGFDYAETTLTDAEMAAADPKRVLQYERGIITGGELDCLTRFGVMPDRLAK